MAERSDEPIQAVAGRASLVAEMHPLMLGRDPLDQAPHALLGCVHLAEIAHLAPTLAVSNRNSVTHLGNIDPDKNLCRMVHGSSSCDEDRLGPPEQPSLEQNRPSHLSPRDGHTVLRASCRVKA